MESHRDYYLLQYQKKQLLEVLFHQFQLVLQQSNSLIINNLQFRFLVSKKNLIGFTIKKKLGQATQRNLFKRRCRELFMNRIKKQPMIYLVVAPQKRLCHINNIDDSFLQLEKHICA